MRTLLCAIPRRSHCTISARWIGSRFWLRAPCLFGRKTPQSETFRRWDDLVYIPVNLVFSRASFARAFVEIMRLRNSAVAHPVTARVKAHSHILSLSGVWRLSRRSWMFVARADLAIKAKSTRSIFFCLGQIHSEILPWILTGCADLCPRPRWVENDPGADRASHNVRNVGDVRAHLHARLYR